MRPLSPTILAAKLKGQDHNPRCSWCHDTSILYSFSCPMRLDRQTNDASEADPGMSLIENASCRPVARQARIDSSTAGWCPHMARLRCVRVTQSRVDHLLYEASGGESAPTVFKRLHTRAHCFPSCRARGKPERSHSRPSRFTDHRPARDPNDQCRVRIVRCFTNNQSELFHFRFRVCQEPSESCPGLPG